MVVTNFWVRLGQSLFRWSDLPTLQLATEFSKRLENKRELSLITDELLNSLLDRLETEEARRWERMELARKLVTNFLVRTHEINAQQEDRKQ